jgi:hypothetical protein
MELWIRSQDKNCLVNIKAVIMLNKEIRGYYNENPNWFLGKYDNEERALEVLNEIQNFIERKDIEGNRYYKNEIYKMPEE